MTAAGGGWDEELMEQLPPTISQTWETDNTFDKLVASVKVRTATGRYRTLPRYSYLPIFLC